MNERERTLRAPVRVETIRDGCDTCFGAVAVAFRSAICVINANGKSNGYEKNLFLFFFYVLTSVDRRFDEIAAMMCSCSPLSSSLIYYTIL